MNSGTRPLTSVGVIRLRSLADYDTSKIEFAGYKGLAIPINQARHYSKQLVRAVSDEGPRPDLRGRVLPACKGDGDRRSDHGGPESLAKRLCFTLHLLGTFSTECHHPVS
jgi:hypothetical protein